MMQSERSSMVFLTTVHPTVLMILRNWSTSISNITLLSLPPTRYKSYSIAPWLNRLTDLIFLNFQQKTGMKIAALTFQGQGFAIVLSATSVIYYLQGSIYSWITSALAISPIHSTTKMEITFRLISRHRLDSLQWGVFLKSYHSTRGADPTRFVQLFQKIDFWVQFYSASYFSTSVRTAKICKKYHYHFVSDLGAEPKITHN